MAQSEALERAVQMFRTMVPEPSPRLADLRRGYDRFLGSFAVPEDAVVTAVDAGGVPSLWVQAPGTSAQRAALLLHGGGFVMGTASGYRELAYRLSAAADCAVLVVDYRLAPEHPYPAATDDARSAYAWLRQRVAAERIWVVGDSAGGGLALGTLVALRDAGEVLPAAAVLLSPLVDLAAEGESMTLRAGLDPVAGRAGVLEHGQDYLAGRDPKSTPVGSPLYADLAQLPPVLVMVGSAEALLDDSRRVAARLAAAGGRVELVVAEDMIHIWPIFASFLPEGQEAIRRLGEFARAHTP